MGYEADYQSFLGTATATPLDDTARLVFADNCDDDERQAGGAAVRTHHGISARGALVRAMIELRKKPRDATLNADVDALIEQNRPLLLAELGAIEGWQDHVAPHAVGGLQEIKNERLKQILDNGMIGYAEFDGRTFPNQPGVLPTPLEEMAQRMPISKLTLKSDSHRRHAWLNEAHVKRLPQGLRELEIQQGVMSDMAAQNALFKHPAFKGLRSLKLAEPESGHRSEVYIDPGLAHPPQYSPNTNYEAAADTLDQAFARRLGAAVGDQLNTLTLDYGHVQEAGVRELLGNPKLKNTVIELTGKLYSHHMDVAGPQAFGQQIPRQAWVDLVQHNVRAARAQGGEYQLQDFVKNAINDNRTNAQWLARQYVNTAEDVMPKAERAKPQRGKKAGNPTDYLPSF